MYWEQTQAHLRSVWRNSPPAFRMGTPHSQIGATNHSKLQSSSVEANYFSNSFINFVKTIFLSFFLINLGIILGLLCFCFFFQSSSNVQGPVYNLPIERFICLTHLIRRKEITEAMKQRLRQTNQLSGDGPPLCMAVMGEL